MAEQFIASKQLPYVLQSTKLKNFFDATVDQWFKNENSSFEREYEEKTETLLQSWKKTQKLPTWGQSGFQKMIVTF